MVGGRVLGPYPAYNFSCLRMPHSFHSFVPNWTPGPFPKSNLHIRESREGEFGLEDGRIGGAKTRT